MRGTSIGIALIALGYFIWYKYIRTPDTRTLRFLDDFNWYETTVDHYYGGLEYVVLFIGLFLAFLIGICGG